MTKQLACDQPMKKIFNPRCASGRLYFVLSDKKRMKVVSFTGYHFQNIYFLDIFFVYLCLTDSVISEVVSTSFKVCFFFQLIIRSGLDVNKAVLYSC